MTRWDRLRPRYEEALRAMSALVLELRAEGCAEQADEVTRQHDALARAAVEHGRSERHLAVVKGAAE